MNVRCLLLLALAACSDPDPVDPPTERVHVMTMTPNLDVLFVIDDSASMADKQSSFTAAFPALIAELAQANPNLHLGVTSTDLGTSAAGGGTPGPTIGMVGLGGCMGFGNAGKLLVRTAPVTGKYIELNRDGTDNFSGTLADAFSQMASLGATGCGFEQQLGAMKTALENTTDNAGFVRAGANLGVIILTDEDDCSAASPSLFDLATTPELGNLDSFRCFRHGVECAEDPLSVGVKTQCKPRGSQYVADVAPYRDFLLALKQGEARRVMFGTVIGAPSKVEVETRMINGQSQLALKHSCEYTSGTGTAVADPGVRLATLAKNLARGTETSICNDDLTTQATKLGTALRGLVDDTCLDEELPATADCVVTDHLADGSTANAAFHFTADATCAGKQRVVIDRPSAAAFDTWSTLSCSL